MKFKVDRKACIGCGVCVSLCEKCFHLKGGLAEASKEECEKGCDGENVISSCPAGAIREAQKK